MNISLSEIILVLVIALLVIKPEHLPGVANSVGRLLGRASRFSKQIKKQLTGLIDESQSSSSHESNIKKKND